MKTWEVMKLLEEGYKLRRKCWKYGDYIKLNKIGRIFNKRNNPCPIQFSMLWEDWEVVIDK